MSEGSFTNDASSDQNNTFVRIDLNNLLPHSNIQQLLAGPHGSLRLQRYLTHQLHTHNNTQLSQSSSTNPTMNQPRVQDRLHNEPPVTPSDSNANQGSLGNTWTAFLSQNPEWNMAVKFMLQYVPFLVIVLIKEGYEHGSGIVVLLSLGMAFWHANKTVQQEAVQQAKRKLGSLAAVSFNLVTCMAFVYFLSADGAPFRSALLWPPASMAFTLWGLVWHVLITDSILKLVTILVKALFTMLPGAVVPYMDRGNHYVFIEVSFQLYRAVATVQPWVFYLLNTHDNNTDWMSLVGRVNGIVLCASYLFCKFYAFMPLAARWRTALTKLVHNTNFGTAPTTEQLEAAGPLCPICQDEYNAPTCLQCRHIFCKSCLAVWLSKERTCPLCRSNVAEDPQWKDGSTTFFVQWF